MPSGSMTGFKPEPNTKVSPYPPLDFLDNHPCLLDQDTHYRLLSKRDLALSGLPTPQTTIIDGRLSPSDIHNDQAVEVESQRIIQAVHDQAPPFVIKFPQSLAGQGVFVVRNESTKAKRIPLLETEIPRMIRRLTTQNAHLQPISLLLQELIDTDDTKNISPFITKRGRAVFVSCAKQFLDEEGIYRGSILDYARQGEYEALYRPIADRIATYVFEKGYYGPMGADIMTTDSPQSNTQQIVDLNVRLPGDYMLGPLRGHFYSRRGLGFSFLITPLVVLGHRDDFEKKFERELEDGGMVIVGWSRGEGGTLLKGRNWSVGSVAMGGIDRADVLQIVERANALGLTKPA